MGLAAGTKLGRYEIVAPLGSGGMGEVYRARDAQLGRIVAIKILPPEFSSNKERLTRFEREARSASALNHPNIVTIYELGHEAGKEESTHFIAMELIDGRTLRQLMDASPLAIRKVIDIAAQVAEGLAKAHEANIAHRDIKPANLMMTEDGFVKIVDFGLAKLAPGTKDVLEGQTESGSGSKTQPGIVVGTPEYMSPEQVGGGGLDFRSDQFSFGVVLYEMVTGKKAFRRATPAETLAAVVREPIDSAALQASDAPAPLCWAIERCLAKDSEKRYVSTRDLARELAAIRDRFDEKPTARAGETRGTNIPVQRTGFVGREEEVGAAKELLLRDSVRLLTVTGPGGIGKTRLAVEVAGALVKSFPRGIYFVPLAPLNDPELLVASIVQTLGLRGGGGQSPTETLRKSFQDTLRLPLLLVLDNFEHLMQAAATVAELLEMGPNLKILVTSRAALHVYGEHEFPVPPLALPDAKSTSAVETLSQFPAVALFVQRAVASKPDFELNKENASAIIEICSRLDGLPLAIELAAARVKVLSPSAMRTRLASRLQLLTGGARDLPQRQQTLRGAIDWSYDLLSAPEQTLFRRLAVFVGGCTLEAVEAVCDTKGDLGVDLLDGMCSMVDKSLLQQVEQANGEPRFAMLETIREYAREKLEASAEARATRRAHAAYCLVLAEEAVGQQSGNERLEWLERLTLEHDNFRASLEWLTETGNAEWGLRLGASLFRFWEMREYFTEGRERLGKLLKLPTTAAQAKARSRVVFAAAVLASDQGDYEVSARLFQESLDIARELKDRHGVAVSLNGLGVVTRDRGDLEKAHAIFAEDLEVWRELGDQAAVALCLSNFASVVKMEGDYARAHALYEECIATFGKLRDRTGVAWSLDYQGDMAAERRKFDEARSYYEQGLAIFRELDDKWGTAGTLADLGSLAREQEDCGTAHSLYRESLKLFRELEHKRGIARLLECFAGSAAVQHQPERALRLAGTAAAVRQNIGAPLTPTEQAKLEALLQPARDALPHAEDVTAWLEGWSSPVEKVVEEVLREPAASPSVC